MGIPLFLLLRKSGVKLNFFFQFKIVRNMNVNSYYIESCDSTTDLKKAGVILKGSSRTTRQPVHMMLLCDTSGSMQEQGKLQSVKRSIALLNSLLTVEDRLSLVTFADASKIVLNSVIPTPEDRQAIQYRIESLVADGSTNMSAGLLDVRKLMEPASSGRKQGTILLTDGFANIGVVQDEALVEIVKRIQTEAPGVTLTTVAYGVDHNAELLTQLAATGGGAYNVVKDLEDVATVFGDILGGLFSVSAQGVEIQLPPGAEPITSYRCEKDVSGMTTVYVGDIYADAEITILFKNNPEKGPIRVKGTDMTSLNSIDLIVEPVAFTASNPPPKAIRITELRQRTADLLKRIANNNRTGLLEEIEILVGELNSDESIRDHPLKPMLLEDLVHAKTLLATKKTLDASTTVEMAQHSAYFAMSRGLRTNTRPAPTHPPGLGLTRSPPAFLSPFANDTQTQIATVMRSMSSQPQEDSETPH